MRSHYCADLGEQNIGEAVSLCGWCNTYRDHGGIIFIDLRDRSGLVQLVLDPKDSGEAHKIASEVRDEYVLVAKGKVRARGKGLEFRLDILILLCVLGTRIRCYIGSRKLQYLRW